MALESTSPDPILVVDDDAAVAGLMAAVLRREKLEAQVVSDGPSALEALGDGRWRLVLTDMTMPGMSGLELVRTAAERGLPATFLLVSAYLDSTQEGEVLAEADIVGVVRKPFDVSQLVADVRGVLAVRAATTAAPSPAPTVLRPAARRPEAGQAGQTGQTGQTEQAQQAEPGAGAATASPGS